MTVSIEDRIKSKFKEVDFIFNDQELKEALLEDLIEIIEMYGYSRYEDGMAAEQQIHCEY